jgi:hypothetical protein
MKKFMKFQEKYLLDCIKVNESTTFGRNHKFNEIDTIKAYKENVDVTDYRYHEPYIASHMEDGCSALVTGEILLFELSSGSTSASKYIPYTRDLKEDFMAGVKPWLFDLYSNYKTALVGKSYWSISPINEVGKRTKNGIPIGFEDDTGYFNLVQSWLFNKVFTVPNEVKFIKDIDDFRYVTLLFLLSEKKLSLISVWNPTFLTLLLDGFYQHFERLISDIENGTINPPVLTELPQNLYKKMKPNTNRSKELRDIIKGKKELCQTRGIDGLFSEIWPFLKVISCWDQGNSKKLANKLEKYFSGVTIQGKGLLATEGLITFPATNIGHIVSYKSHFFEFIDLENENTLTKGQDTKLLNQLEEGHKYSVLMTTRGGFYRYKLHDIVKVTGHYKDIPLLEFVGKEENVSDYYGEKLNEYHVNQILSRLDITSDFYFIAPNNIGDSFFYGLYIKEEDLSSINIYQKKIEEGLLENYHYEYARHLDQIKPIRTYVMTGECEKAYYEYYNDKKKMKLGDVKYLHLSKVLNLHKYIGGYFVD